MVILRILGESSAVAREHGELALRGEEARLHEAVFFGDDSGAVGELDPDESESGDDGLVIGFHRLGGVKFGFKFYEAHLVLPLENEDFFDLPELRELVSDALLGDLLPLVGEGHDDDVVGDIFQYFLFMRNSTSCRLIDFDGVAF